jgi:hypothetical protein
LRDAVGQVDKSVPSRSITFAESFSSPNSARVESFMFSLHPPFYGETNAGSWFRRTGKTRAVTDHAGSLRPLRAPMRLADQP